jgi:hypothetical protein
MTGTGKEDGQIVLYGEATSYSAGKEMSLILCSPKQPIIGSYYRPNKSSASLHTNLCKIHFNIILPLMPRLLSGVFRFSE